MSSVNNDGTEPGNGENLVSPDNTAQESSNNSTLSSDESDSPDDVPAIGIDLGTTFSCAAVYQNKKSEVVPNKAGHRLTPSLIFYHTDSLEVSCGNAANDIAPERLENFLFDMKRIIGRKYDDAYVQKLIESKSFTYRIVRGEDDRAEISLLHDGLEVQKSPEQACSEILKYLRESACEQLGNVTEAVISVPAKFSGAQRKATKAAAELAGFKVLKLITEPVAAAVYYVNEKLKSDARLLVFDFGGGTLDVSIIELFRHGDRNPDSSSIISSSPYYNESYYPEGYGQLTNDGKRTEYNIGNELRSRYNSFLTKTWNINYLEARTTNVNRTKMSLELMLAALYPPRGDQIWSLLFWQPIPYNYYQSSEDKEIYALSACSAVWASLYSNITSSSEISEYLTRYDTMFAILSAQVGSTVSSMMSAFNYYFGFATQEEVGYELEAWTSTVYPEPIHSAAVDFYYLMTNTTAIRRSVAGYLLRKILGDTAAKINGTISPSERKMFIYSAHEINVATLLLSLDAYKLTDIPAYGAYVLFEVHEIDGVWGFKLFYQDYENDDPHALTIPGCDHFCPYDDFYALVEEILPTDDTDCYGS